MIGVAILPSHTSEKFYLKSTKKNFLVGFKRKYKKELSIFLFQNLEHMSIKESNFMECGK